MLRIVVRTLCLIFIFLSYQAHAKMYGFKEFKDGQESYSFILDIDIKEYQDFKIVPKKNDGITDPVDKTLITFFECISESENIPDACFGSNVSSEVVSREFPYAKSIEIMVVEKRLKWGNHYSYVVSIKSKEARYAHYYIVTFDCENLELCKPSLDLSNNRQLNNSLTEYEALSAIFNTVQFADKVANVDTNSFSKFPILSPEGDVSVFLKMEVEDDKSSLENIKVQSLIEDLNECDSKGCSRAEVSNVVQSRLGKNSSSSAYALAVMDKNRTVVASGLLNYESYVSILENFKYCESKLSIQILSERKLIFECNDLDGKQYLIVLPFDNEGFSKEYVVHSEDILLSSFAAMSFFKKLIDVNVTPYQAAQFYGELPGYRITNGTAEKIAMDLRSDHEEVEEAKGLLTNRIIIFALSILSSFLIIFFIIKLKKNK